MADRLDAMSVRIDNEGSVVIAMIDRARTGSAVVATAGRNCGGMKRAHRLAIRRTKTEVQTARG